MVSQDEINSNFLVVIRWLKSEYGYTQAYIVEKAELAPNAISKIKNGKANAGDETITKLCNAFNLNSDYFYGRSSYKTKLEESEAKLDENIRQAQASIQSQPYIDPGSQMNATIAAQMKTIEILEAQAVEKDIRIAELKDTIASKEEIIKAREARIVELERQLAAAATSDLSRYPFSFGAADGHNLPDVSPNP
jgi:transcriptional regulator with XRE-family HTH domain